MTPSCLERVCAMFARDRLLSGPLYTTHSAAPGGHAEVLVWERCIGADPVLRRWDGNAAIERALLHGLRALQAQGRVVRCESLSLSGTAQRLCAAPGVST